MNIDELLWECLGLSASALSIYIGPFAPMAREKKISPLTRARLGARQHCLVGGVKRVTLVPFSGV